MKTKTQEPRQYIATGIVGIFAIISWLSVMYKKNINTHTQYVIEKNVFTASITSAEVRTSSWRNQTLEELCTQEKCIRKKIHKECLCNDN